MVKRLEKQNSSWLIVMVVQPYLRVSPGLVYSSFQFRNGSNFGAAIRDHLMFCVV